MGFEVQDGGEGDGGAIEGDEPDTEELGDGDVEDEVFFVVGWRVEGYVSLGDLNRCFFLYRSPLRYWDRLVHFDSLVLRISGCLTRSSACSPSSQVQHSGSGISLD